MPMMYIIAGPNGAGKTTFAREFLPRTVGCLNFVNADLIAQGISPFAPEAAALQAGRMMLHQIDQYIRRGTDFAFETTLSGRSWLPLLRRARACGYRIELFFLWLPQVEQSIRRVADRVRKGGHHIPEDVIRRRFTKGIANLLGHYRPVLDVWTIYDSSSGAGQVVATEDDGQLKIFDHNLFEEIQLECNIRI